MSCDNCKLMDASLDSISVAAHETEMKRAERCNKRLLWLCIALVVAVVATNLGWLIFFGQFNFESESYDYSQDGRGINIIGNDNEADQYGTEIADTP